MRWVARDCDGVLFSSSCNGWAGRASQLVVTGGCRGLGIDKQRAYVRFRPGLWGIVGAATRRPASSLCVEKIASTNRVALDVTRAKTLSCSWQAKLSVA